MKLAKVTKNDPIERLAVGLHQSTMNLLKDYQAFYLGNSGEEIPMSLMVEEMLKTFMADDKAFQKFKQGPKPSKPAVATDTPAYLLLGPDDRL